MTNEEINTIKSIFDELCITLNDFEFEHGKSRELSLVKTKLEEAEMWFNKVKIK